MGAIPGLRVTRTFGMVTGAAAVTYAADDNADQHLRNHGKATARARAVAIRRMQEAALRHGANTILSVFFESVPVEVSACHAITVTAHGTACRMEATPPAAESVGQRTGQQVRTALSAGLLLNALKDEG